MKKKIINFCNIILFYAYFILHFENIYTVHVKNVL